MSSPLVSIVLPVRDGAAWLDHCLTSAALQTERNFELIVLDDGSTDATPEILSRWAARDDRLRVVTGPHRGLVASLNHGLELARGQFVARLDADDWWTPNRLTHQLTFMEANPDHGLVGSAIWHADESGRLTGRAVRPVSDLMIRWKALIWCPFTHSAVLMRRQLLVEHDLRYDAAREGAEDYDLWVRLLQVTRGHNLPQRLVVKRRHQSMSVERAEEFVPIRVAISRCAIEAWAPGFEATDRELIDVRDAFHTMGRARFGGRSRGDAIRITSRLIDLLECFMRAHPDAAGMEDVLDFELVRIGKDLGPSWNLPALLRVVNRMDRLRPGFSAPYWDRQWTLARKRLRSSTKRILENVS